MSAVPCPQSMQVKGPTSVFCVPALHALHVDVASTSVPSNPLSHRQPDTADTATAPFVPELSVHAVQDVAAVNEYVSAAQSVQAVAGLESKSAVPAAQSVQDVAPCAAY